MQLEQLEYNHFNFKMGYIIQELKVQLTRFLVFVSNYLSYNFKRFFKNVFVFGQVLLFS